MNEPANGAGSQVRAVIARLSLEITSSNPVCIICRGTRIASDPIKALQQKPTLDEPRDIAFVARKFGILIAEMDTERKSPIISNIFDCVEKYHE